MDRQQIGLKLTMDRLGLEVKVDAFDDRLILQKAVYLAQAAGVRLGYSYRWYLRGPYCPAVADDAFAMTSEGMEEAEGWTLDEGSSTKLDRLCRLFENAGADRTGLARKLELLASVHFLIDRQQVPDDSPEQIAAVLQEYGKDFQKADVEIALKELDHGNLR